MPLRTFGFCPTCASGGGTQNPKMKKEKSARRLRGSTPPARHRGGRAGIRAGRRARRRARRRWGGGAAGVSCTCRRWRRWRAAELSTSPAPNSACVRAELPCEAGGYQWVAFSTHTHTHTHTQHPYDCPVPCTRGPSRRSWRIRWPGGGHLSVTLKRQSGSPTACVRAIGGVRPTGAQG